MLKSKEVVWVSARVGYQVDLLYCTILKTNWVLFNFKNEIQLIFVSNFFIKFIVILNSLILIRLHLMLSLSPISLWVCRMSAYFILFFLISFRLVWLSRVLVLYTLAFRDAFNAPNNSIKLVNCDKIWKKAAQLCYTFHI